MKSLFIKAGLASCLALGLPLFQDHALAASSSNVQSKCSSLGILKKGINPSYQHMNCLLTQTAIEAGIPPEIMKAVATQENNSWRQFDKKGKPVISSDKGIGVMQITNQKRYDTEKLKYDIPYNLKAGADLLNDMYSRSDLPSILPKDKDVLETWYFAVMAYNGTKPINSPLYQSTGKVNTNAYQEKVWTHLNSESFLEDTTIRKPAFSVKDFKYDPKNKANIIFLKKTYTLSSLLHQTRYGLKKNDKVIASWDNSNLNEVRIRKSPSTGSSFKWMKKGSQLTITGPYSFDRSLNSSNPFVWYPVSVPGQKGTWYIASSYITKMLSKPTVSPVNSKSRQISGKAVKNSVITVKKGSSRLGTIKTNSTGSFTMNIPLQKAGTVLQVTYKDSKNATSPAAAVKVTAK
ncbi:Ig-like domain-containing protein [Fictibacillus fluitans]|uniref:Ig-like domain-containing protein n=1 Tax=Fictibacillus fluitans TaxID=3058422 RepID=A0ABT8I3E9_9BACL|nr:Ig-like domain-containing protein [Fictibacillus sp. NE201]MDN4527559.1 Ig-like domain-containing protein [Fictibacillus sp. NE201]